MANSSVQVWLGSLTGPSSDGSIDNQGQAPPEPQGVDIHHEAWALPQIPQVEGLRQIFFDCDNTLVQSEETALQCTAELVNEVLASHGIDERYTTEQLLMEYFGLTFKAMLVPLQAKHKFIMSDEEINSYIMREEDAVIEELIASAQECPGATYMLDMLRENTDYGLAVVSSSQGRRIDAALQACGLDEFFSQDRVFSAKTSMPTAISKPDPAIYLYAMEKLGVKPGECVAIEDSRSGVRSAVGAGLSCIAYVGAYPSKVQQEQVGQLLMEAGCAVVMYDWLEFGQCLQRAKS